MIEAKGNLWGYPADWRCITTNGFIKNDGTAVMGRGCALEAKKKYPQLPKILAQHIKDFGNVLGVIFDLHLITFPVKHNWWEKADLNLIQKSTDSLSEWIYNHKSEVIVMPKPGCGNGNLNWKDVKPIVSYLPDNVVIIDFN